MSLRLASGFLVVASLVGIVACSDSGGTGATSGSGGGGQGGSTSSAGGAGQATVTTGSVGGSSQGGEGGAFNPATDPTVTINHPGDGECRVVNMQFPVVGVASDPQDGDLTAALVWANSADAAFPTSGNNFDYTPTTLGAHIITASVVDADGNSGSDTVTLMIQNTCP